jgi:hypothetical protein
MWWMTALGYTPAQIVQAGEPDGTLASNYQALTGKPKTQAFTDFKTAVAAAGGPTSDNPWNAPTPPYPLTPVPPPVPNPTCSIAASPQTIQVGQSSFLSWNSVNGLTATLNGVNVPLNGSKSVAPLQTTTYSLTVNGGSAGTAPAKASTTVMVVAQPIPTTPAPIPTPPPTTPAPVPPGNQIVVSMTIPAGSYVQVSPELVEQLGKSGVTLAQFWAIVQAIMKILNVNLPFPLPVPQEQQQQT